MTQTLAIFYEAYRNLNSKKLFWIVLALSGLSVAAFACVGINETGIKILTWQIDIEQFNSRTMPPGAFYKLIFVQLGIGFWLSWLATILALVSTAGIFPDLMTSGSIDLFVSKPISRLRLFVTEYVAGLLFVTLQVTVFSLASFLVIGLRGGAWEPGLFVAIPVVVCFFSYLFAVCVLLGVLTRSTVAALLLTLLFWFLVYAIGAAENTVLMFKTMNEEGVSFSGLQAESAANRSRGGSTADHPKAESPAESPPPAASDEPGGSETPRPSDEPRDSDERAASEEPRPSDEPRDSDEPAASDEPMPSEEPAAREEPRGNRALDVAHRILYAVKTVLPKTSETIALLERWLVNLAELPQQTQQGASAQQQQRMQAAQQEFAEEIRGRSLGWVVGTSLGFELIVLAAAAWLFCRRDY